MAKKAAPKKATKAKPAKVEEKPKKGKAAKEAAAPAAPKGAGVNASLAKAIDANPDDADAWSVYADWLQEQGDPRGELGSVQEQLRASPKDKALATAERKLLKDNAEQLVGSDLLPYFAVKGKLALPSVLAKQELEPDFREPHDTPVRAFWKSGFFQQINIGYPGYDWSPTGKKDEDAEDDGNGPSVDMKALLKQLLDHPSSRFLSNLRLGMPNNMADSGECDFGNWIKLLEKHEALDRLRTLYIGDVTQEESECDWVDIGDISKLYPRLKNLRSLTIRGGGRGLKLGTMNLPELRELTIITGGLSKKNIASICAAKWPKLEHLELWLGTDDYGGDAKVKDLKPIFEGKIFPKVKYLGLCNADIADEIAAELPTAKILKQLDTLDLSKGCMTDAGAKHLIDHADAFAHIRSINVSDNFLKKTSAAIASIAKGVRTRPQREADSWTNEDGTEEIHRYVSLGE